MLPINLALRDTRNDRSDVRLPVRFNLWMSQFCKLMALWLRRSRTRHDLSKLDGHLLRDIGMSEFDQHREMERPFWR